MDLHYLKSQKLNSDINAVISYRKGLSQNIIEVNNQKMSPYRYLLCGCNRKLSFLLITKLNFYLHCVQKVFPLPQNNHADVTFYQLSFALTAVNISKQNYTYSKGEHFLDPERLCVRDLQESLFFCLYVSIRQDPMVSHKFYRINICFVLA